MTDEQYEQKISELNQEISELKFEIIKLKRIPIATTYTMVYDRNPITGEYKERIVPIYK